MTRTTEDTKAAEEEYADEKNCDDDTERDANTTSISVQRSSILANGKDHDDSEQEKSKVSILEQKSSISANESTMQADDERAADKEDPAIEESTLQSNEDGTTKMNAALPLELESGSSKPE